MIKNIKEYLILYCGFMFISLIVLSPFLYDLYQQNQIKVGDYYIWCYQVDNPFDNGYCEEVKILDKKDNYVSYEITKNGKYSNRVNETQSNEISSFLHIYKKLTKGNNY